MSKPCLFCGAFTDAHEPGCLAQELDERQARIYALSSVLSELVSTIRPDSPSYFAASQAAKLLADPTISGHAQEDELLEELGDLVASTLENVELQTMVPELSNFWVRAELILDKIVKLNPGRLR